MDKVFIALHNAALAVIVGGQRWRKSLVIFGKNISVLSSIFNVGLCVILI